MRSTEDAATEDGVPKRSQGKRRNGIGDQRSATRGRERNAQSELRILLIAKQQNGSSTQHEAWMIGDEGEQGRDGSTRICNKEQGSPRTRQRQKKTDAVEQFPSSQQTCVLATSRLGSKHRKIHGRKTDKMILIVPRRRETS